MQKQTLVTAAAQKAVGMSEAKDHLRITHTDDEGYIYGLIDAAQDYVEKLISRKLITQTWKQFYEAWPSGDDLVLPFGQLQSVTHVKYTDSDDTVNTDFNEGDEFSVDTDSDPGRIVLGYGEVWPGASLATENPIEVQFVAGYGDDPADVPMPIRQAIYIIISDLYENRESNLTGTIRVDLKTVERLLLPYRLY